MQEKYPRATDETKNCYVARDVGNMLLIQKIMANNKPFEWTTGARDSVVDCYSFTAPVASQLHVGGSNSIGVTIMRNEYTAVVKQEGDWWIGWIAEIPGVNCQEKTFDELKETLRITLKEALEFNRQDALTVAGNGYLEEKIAV